METNKQLKIWKSVSVIAIAFLVVLGVLYANTLKRNKDTQPEVLPDEEVSYLTLWNDNAKAKVWLEE